MKILIAEDTLVSRRLLQASLEKWGHEVVVACDGEEAWRMLNQDEAPRLAVLDWMMPGMDGVQVCRMVRESLTDRPVYIILLTAKGRKEDIVEGLQSGADDYVTKPFNRDELRARVNVGARVVGLQETLADRVTQLEEALSQVRQLSGLLPICSYCKRIRDDRNYWQQVERYVQDHSAAQFTHSICPECYEKFVLPELERLHHEGQSNE